MLRNVVSFCENKSDCRRAQVLNYFSENFRPEDCQNTCDNCRSDAKFVTKNLTEYAAAALELVKELEEHSVTLLQCVDAFRGSTKSRLKSYAPTHFGKGGNFERGVVERLFQKMIEDGAMVEESVRNKAGFVTNYLKVCY